MLRALAAFLGLAPRSVGLPEPLSEDIDLLDRLLGRVLGEQGRGTLVQITGGSSRDRGG